VHRNDRVANRIEQAHECRPPVVFRIRWLQKNDTGSNAADIRKAFMRRF